MLKRPAVLAASAVALLWFCQFLTVHYNYGGDWTGLFCISPHMPVPEFLRLEHPHLFQNSDGYDGQIFHLMAHDPWMTRGSAAAIVGNKFRYQRILVPALAWMLALGRDKYVHAAYFAVILGFAFLGIYWLARLAERRGLHPAWGLAFVAVPATITSLDRMTVDIALAAFCVGFAYYAESGPLWRIVAILAAAVLTRETGVLLVAGYCLFLLTRGHIVKATAAACSLLPAFAWFLYVTRGIPRYEAVRYLTWIPLDGFLQRVLHPAVYSLGPWKDHAAVLFDYVALAGVAVLLAGVARLAMDRRWNAEAAAIYLFALAVVLLGSRDVWQDAYNFGRVLSPVLLLAFIEHLDRRRLLAYAPLLLIDMRISLNLAGELEGVAHGLLK